NPEYGGYLLNNRKYNINYEQSSLAVVPADPFIYYLMHFNSSKDTEPKNTHPSYLFWCPTIWSDGSAKTHSKQTGPEGGSSDWFCLSQTLSGQSVGNL
ncbi:MAG: hypothetical protein NUV81_03700, partial [bacterium]|nr:hypothetical protein [bacterium]